MRSWVVFAVLTSLIAGCGDSNSSSSSSDDQYETTASGDTVADSGAGDAVEDVAGAPGCEEATGETDIGLVNLNAEGFSDRIFFDIPECAVSFAVILEGPDQVHLILDSLIGPNGAVIVTGEGGSGGMALMGPFPGQMESPQRMASGGGVSTVLVPSSPGIAIQAGPWEMVVQGGTPGGGFGGSAVTPYSGGVTVGVIWKNVDTATEGGVLDLNLHFTGAGELTATNAPDSLLMQGALTELSAIYGEAGVTIGEIRYFDIDESFSTIRSIEGPSNMLSNMFRLSEGNEPGLNFFFVDRFELQGMPGGAIGGISGGVPGPPLRPGTGKSGVAVSMAAVQRNSATMAHIMGHEGGHFLGLFHVVEIIGTSDALDDTPIGRDAASNLMYPAVGGDTTLTPEQSWVFHGNPEVTE